MRSEKAPRRISRYFVVVSQEITIEGCLEEILTYFNRLRSMRCMILFSNIADPLNYYLTLAIK